MSWSMFDVVPFGAGSSLCPPDPPPCICGDRVDPSCPCCGDSDFLAAGGARNDVPAGADSPPVPAVDAYQT